MKNAKLLTLPLAIALLAGSCGKKLETTESGVEYRVITHEEGARVVAKNDLLLLNLRISTEQGDSVILETFQNNEPRYIPSDEAVLQEVFASLAKNDSVEILVNADTLFNKSFGVPKPQNMKPNEKVRFYVKVVDIFNQDEMRKKGEEQKREMVMRDSVLLQETLNAMTDIQRTPSNILYSVLQAGHGKAAKKGDKVKVNYTGRFTNGTIFDTSIEKMAKDGAIYNEGRIYEPIEVTIGLGQVIQGWEEALTLMKEGDKMRFVIPYYLAYGERGDPQHGMPPMATLIFDIEMVKVN